jgi:hypothetical protein
MKTVRAHVTRKGSDTKRRCINAKPHSSRPGNDTISEIGAVSPRTDSDINPRLSRAANEFNSSGQRPKFDDLPMRTASRRCLEVNKYIESNPKPTGVPRFAAERPEPASLRSASAPVDFFSRLGIRSWKYYFPCPPYGRARFPLPNRPKASEGLGH